LNSKLSQSELAQAIDFCAAAFDHMQPEENLSVMQKITSNADNNINRSIGVYHETFSIEELRVINHIQARNIMDTRSIFDLR
jgi:hypothetical protein